MRPVLRLVVVVVLTAASPALAQDFLALLEWGRTNCDMAIPVELQQQSTGSRDILALKPLKALDTVFIIPDKCLITTAKARAHPSTYGLFNPQMASQSPERSQFYQKRQDYDSAMLPLMLLHIMDEGNDGFFAPYLRVLPTDVGNFVCLWGEEEVSLLPFNTIVDVFTICNNVRAMYDAICAVVPAFGEKRSFMDWQRAWLLANSRHLALTVNGEPHTALAPLYDSFNHAMQASVCWKYSNDILGVGAKVMRMNVTNGECIADEDFVVPAGTVLRLSYAYGQARPSQSKLLLYYGFTLPCEWETRWRLLLPNHTVVVGSDDSDREDPWDIAASMCLDKLKLRTENAAYELTAARDGIDDAAFLESVRRSSDQLGDGEVSMWRAVHRLVASVEFPLSVAEAGARLEAATPASCEYDALNVLVGQHSVAMAWMAHATKVIAKQSDQTLPSEVEARSQEEACGQVSDSIE